MQNDWERNFWKMWQISEDELNTKSNKRVYVKNDVMTTVIKQSRVKKIEVQEK